MTRTGPVILVVEDNPGTRDVLQELLGEEGYTVEAVADGSAGLARIEAGGIDLVVLDLMLPEMNGFELCQRVRAQEGGAHLPILMLTSLDDTGEQVAGLAVGADDYVTKPFQAAVLLARVRRLLRRPAAAPARP